MEKQNIFMMTHEELFKGEPKKIAVVADGLTKEEWSNAEKLIDEFIAEGKLKHLGLVPKPEYDGKMTNIGFALHECLQMYPHKKDATEKEIIADGKITEFIRTIFVDEVWYFDVGDAALPFDGRLWDALKAWNKPIRFLMRNKDNTSWEFYRSVEFIKNDETDTTEEVFRFIGEIEPYEFTEEELKQIEENKKKRMKTRAISKNELSEQEFELALRALKASKKAEAILLMMTVARADSETAKKLHNEVVRILFSILNSQGLNDEDIRLYGAKLDFLEADIEEL